MPRRGLLRRLPEAAVPPTKALPPAIAGSKKYVGDLTARHGCGPITTLARFGARTRRRRAFAAKPPECRNATVKERANVIARPGTLAHTRVSARLPRFLSPTATNIKA